jgi:3'-5' exoribonuclease
MDKISKRKSLSEYKEGELVRDVFVVKIKRGISDYAKGYYFSLVLTDSSGKSIDYRYWGGPDEVKVKEIYDSIKNDSVMHINGLVSTYQGKLQITSNEQHIIKVLERGEYNEEDFIKKTQKDTNELYSKLEEYINKVSNEKLKLLLRNIFDDEMKKKFKEHPAAISIHHNWIGGLLEHTLEVLSYCELSKKLFPSLDEDLLITGAILHDIGKLEEMEMTTRIKGTNSGMFSGHMLLGSILVSNKMDEIGLEENLKDKILHMIVSHHGRIESGALREPMFPEAVALSHADEMSTRIAEMVNFIEEKKDETEDDFMPKWEKSKPTNIFLR